MANAGETWTEARVQRLKALWEEGLSASQIANALGGVSRNAVIGKVHRLGLSSRAPRAGATGASSRTSGRQHTGVVRSAAMPTARSRGSLAVALEPSPSPALAVEENVIAEIVPLARYLMLVELTPTTCRWPIGDPYSPAFRFCGAPTQPGQSYCAACARKAYQVKRQA